MTAFSSLKIVGGLLPADLLGRVFAGDPQVPGTGPETYGLERGESVRRQASRSWLYLLEVWQDFKRRIDGAGDGPDGGRGPVRAGHQGTVAAHPAARAGLPPDRPEGGFELDGKSFPVSHRSGHVPVHLLGWATDLDHKTPHVTARAPQSMVQELLNRDDAYLWAILSNGATLRLLRDSTALVGSSYVEFDLEAIFDGELFSDFVLLYLICHESRFAVQGDGGPAVLLPGTVARLRRRAGRAGARPAPRRRPAGHLHPRHRVPVPPGQPAAAQPARPAQRRPEAGRLQPRPAAAGVPAAVLVRRRGPGRPAAARSRRRRRRRQGPTARGPRPVRHVLLLRPAAPARPPAPRRPARRPLRGHAARLRRTRHRGRRARTGPARHRRHLRVPARRRPRSSARRAARRCPPVQRGAARRGARAVAGEAARRRRLAAGGLRQPGRRGTRQRLRVAAGADPPLRRRATRLHAGDAARQRAERDRLLLHADLAGRMPAGLRARPAARRGMRARDRRGTGRGAARHHRLRPRLRLRALPRRRRPPDRQARSPPRKPANPSRPTPSSGPRCAASSAAASTASTSTPWPPNWPRCRSGWKHWSPASRCPTSTRTSASATPCSASPPLCWRTACPTRRSPRSRATTARSPRR